jgi:type IV secretory pathway VirB10-like protein
MSQLYASKFEYTFTNVSTEVYSFYTVAIYSNDWGLSDQTKSEY